MPSRNGKTKFDQEGRKRLGDAIITAAARVPADLRQLFMAEHSSNSARDRAERCSDLASSLQEAIGNCMTSPFHVYTKKKSLHKQITNPFPKSCMKAVTYINKCIKYLHLFHNHLIMGTALSDYRKPFVEHALHNSPTSLVNPPALSVPAMKSRSTIDDYITVAKTQRKAFWKEIRMEEARLKKESRNRFQKILKKEEYTCSRMYRNIVYLKKRNENIAITILTDDGSLEFTANGIMDQSRLYWQNLGTPTATPASVADKPWLNNLVYANI
jgi:hypothetical protein